VPLLLLLVIAGLGFGQVAVLEDFETVMPERWRGGVEISRDQASHGVRSARLRFEQPRAEIAFTPPVSDWRLFDRLLFDLHSDREQAQTLSLRIYERADGTSLDDYFEAQSKVIVQNGWNHVEVKLAPLPTASFRRALSLARIEQISLYAESTRLPWTLHTDNFRLVRGAEPAESASRTAPHESVTIIESRWFTVHQVAQPDEIPELSEVKRLRAEAEREAGRMRETIRAAELQGIDTIYSERHLVTAGLGLHGVCTSAPPTPLVQQRRQED
jgi:hypothetical protein